MVITDEGDHHGEMKVIVSSTDPDKEGKKMKTIDLMVLSDKDLNEVSEHENVEVHVIRKGDKDIKVIKKIKVEVEEEESEEEAEKENVMK
jgi:hypothetical protein